MRRGLVVVSVAGLVTFVATTAWANTTTFISATFSEPAQVNFHSGCAVFPEGACGTGEVLPFGQATETIEFGAGCGGTCDLRTITLAEGQLFLEETVVLDCPSGSCHHGPVEGGGTGALTDVVIGGTGLFEGATGELTGTVKGAVSNTRPAGGSAVQLAGTIHYDP
jgi:hypothetical protein